MKNEVITLSTANCAQFSTANCAE